MMFLIMKIYKWISSLYTNLFIFIPRWILWKSYNALTKPIGRSVVHFQLSVFSPTYFQAQSSLILPSPLSLNTLPTVIQEIVGFFIIESHVLRTTRGFRSEREVEELWDSVVSRLGEGMSQALASETDPGVFLDVKEQLIAFSATLEVCVFIHSYIHAS